MMRTLRQLRDYMRRRNHDHSWFRCLRQEEPRIDVFDCGCGARRKVHLSASGMPEIEDGVHWGGSMANALHAMDGNGNNLDVMGDAQGDRLRLLMASVPLEE